MNRHETDVLDALREANPVDADELRADLGDDDYADARQRVARNVRRGAPRRAGRRRLRFAIAAGVGAAAAAAVVGALPAGENSASGPGPLAAAAAIAAEQPSTVPASGQYSYLKLRVGSTESTAGGSSTEWWIGADESGRMAKTTTGLADFETPAGAGWRQTGSGAWVNDRRFAAGRFDGLYSREFPGVVAFDIERLPTAPAALQDTLRRSLRDASRDAEPETGFAPGSIAEQAQMLTLIGQVLAHPLASPELRRALYAVAARLPGVAVRGNVEDPVGRHGTAISFTERIGDTTNRHEVIFDPATSQTLATQLVSSESAAPATQSAARPFTQYVVFLARGLVASLDARP